MKGEANSRARLFLIIGVLLIAVVAAFFLLVLKPKQEADAQGNQVATPLPTVTRPTPTPTTPAPATPAPTNSTATHTATPTTSAHTATTPAPTTAAPVTPPPSTPPATTTASDPNLPRRVTDALTAGHVVVISLYDPTVSVDGTATAEAEAGAAAAHAAFVAVDVTSSEIDGLNIRFGVLSDPAVLVLRPPGKLVVRIDGFADRDTVAQAAANAAT
jgi:hypothetical protein